MLTKKKKITMIIAVACLLLLIVGVAVAIPLSLANRITYKINDTLPDGGGKSAKVILLCGQSNASGCSLDSYLQKNVSEEKYAEYQNGYDNIYINYQTGEQASGEFVRCATGQGEFEGTFGPEVGLAERLHELYPEETFFIIKYAIGGTNLYEQWLSPSSEGKTGEEYRAFEAFVKANLKYLVSKNYDITVEGMCWMQGESDSFSVENAVGYEEHLSNLIDDVRKKFSKYAAEDGIAFVDAYIAENPMFWVYCDDVNRSKSAVAERSELNCIIKTNDLSCAAEPEEKPDIPHYDSLSELELGHRFADALAGYLGEGS